MDTPITCGWPQDVFRFLFGAGRAVDRTALWTGAIALVTSVGAGFALFQLWNIRKTSRADFAKRFVDTFFTKDTRLLFTLLMNSALEFSVKSIVENDEQIDRLPYLRIKGEVIAQLADVVALEPRRAGYTGFEVDDLLLGPFDDLGWYVRRGLIDYETALQSFRFYLISSFETEAIRQYMRDEDNAGMYENVRYLYGKFTASPAPDATASWRLWARRHLKRSGLSAHH